MTVGLKLPTPFDDHHDPSSNGDTANAL